MAAPKIIGVTITPNPVEALSTFKISVEIWPEMQLSDLTINCGTALSEFEKYEVEVNET